MPPRNIKSRRSRSPGPDSQNRRFLKVAGQWYDVSRFVSRHPGGKIIEEYLDTDATDVFSVFHNDLSVLKKVRKVSASSVPYAVRSSIRPKIEHYDHWKGDDDSCAKDFRKLTAEMRKEGFFDVNYFFILGKFLLTIGFWCVSVWLVFSNTSIDANEINWKPLYVAAGCMSLFLQQSGFLMHDLMHNSLFQDRRIDQVIGRFFGSICFGISSAWWRDEHFVHHALTNTYEDGKKPTDPQMTEDTWAQDRRIVQFHDGSIAPKIWLRKLHYLPLNVVNGMINYQAFLWLPLTVGLGRFGIVLESQKKETRPKEKLLLGLHWLWIVSFLYLAFPTISSALKFYYLMGLGQGVLHIQLLLSHYSKPWQRIENVKDTKQWYRWQITSNMNIAPLLSTKWWRGDRFEFLNFWDDYVAPMFDDWFHGGLNLHIEHHCVPTMPRWALREYSRRLKKLCVKHDIPYDERPFVVGILDTLVHMNEVGAKVKFDDVSS